MTQIDTPNPDTKPIPPIPTPKAAFSSSPSLIAALVASVAIAIGSTGTWASMLILSVDGTIGPAGKITLALGLASAALLAAVGFGKIRGLGLGLAITAGVLVFAQGLYSAIQISSVEDVGFLRHPNQYRDRLGAVARVGRVGGTDRRGERGLPAKREMKKLIGGGVVALALGGLVGCSATGGAGSAPAWTPTYATYATPTYATPTAAPTPVQVAPAGIGLLLRCRNGSWSSQFTA